MQPATGWCEQASNKLVPNRRESVIDKSELHISSSAP